MELYLFQLIFVMVCRMLAYKYVCVPCVYSVPGGQKMALDPWDWSCRWLWAAMWVLESNLAPLESSLAS